MVDSPFVWGAGGAQLTPEQIAAQRKIADAMMMRAGDYSPVQSWAQGAARVTEGLVGGLRARSADAASQENAAAEAQLLASLMPGAGAVPAAMPAKAPVAADNAAVALPAPVASRNVAPSRIYSNDESSPLDPPSGVDRARMAATILGESANQPAVGQNAVASVIRSRAVNGGYGGDTPSGVVTARNQFEPWNTETGRAKMAAMMANPALAAKADQAIALAYGEGGQAPNDPTNGAMNFIEPKLQTALGRPMPAWAQKPGVMIGDHKFIGGAPQTAVAAAEDPAALPANAAPAQGYAIPGQPSPAVAQVAAAMPSGVNPRLMQAMASPYVSEGTKKILGVMLQSQMAPAQHIDLGNKVGILDRQGNLTRTIDKGEPNKGPEFGVIGKDEFGTEQYGWRDARTQSTTPVKAPVSASAAPSTIPPAPAGVDPKVWREAQSKRAASEGMPSSFDDTSKLRTELAQLPSYKNISQAAPIYKSMHEAAGRNTKAADLNMVYGLGKMMDPTSVVREGELEMANAAQGVKERLNGIIAQINSEGALTPAGREALMAEAHSRMQSYKMMYDQDAERYRGIATRNRANPDDIVHDFGKFEPWTVPKAPAAPVTIDGYTIKEKAR